MSAVLTADFFQTKPVEVVPSPNGQNWWHHMPLPDGTRIRGANSDLDTQAKMWEALRIPTPDGLRGKSVLDIGANDGYFSLAAFMAGAESVTAINSDDWAEYPHNIRFASQAWGVNPEIITADFRTYDFGRKFDVVFFFGVLYHLEDVFNCMKDLRGLLNPHGVLYIETQMTSVQSDRPIFESASDLYRTTVIQCKSKLHHAGLSNYLLPNDHAMRNLAYSYDFDYDDLGGPQGSRYSREHRERQFFKFTRQEAQ